MRRELYLSILMDRASDGPVLVASQFGGTSIEDVAAATPEAIHQIPIDIMQDTLSDDVAQQMSANLGFEAGSKPSEKMVTLMKNLYKMFRKVRAREFC